MKGIRRVMPWKPTARTGPEWGVAVDADTMIKVIQNSENPLIIVGGGIDSLNGRLFDYIVKLSKRKKIKIIATGNSIKRFNESSVNAIPMGIVEVTNLLLDPNWGLDGKPHDLAIFAGIQYSLNGQVFNSLKNFSDVKTANLSKYYQPNASVSFPNLDEGLWEEYLKKICEMVQK